LTVSVGPGAVIPSWAEKGGVMKKKTKQSEKIIVAMLTALTAMLNFLANLIHLWIK
jgi:hypothetical protein